MSQLLTAHNWPQAVQQAIKGLPADLRSSVGISQHNARTVIVTVAVEPLIDGCGEAFVWHIGLTYWNTLRECGWPKEHDDLYKPGGKLAEMVELPGVRIDNMATCLVRGLIPGRATIKDLRRAVQVQILDAMFEGSGLSMVGKDHKGRFIREVTRAE
jgi:hypothetical protein